MQADEYLLAFRLRACHIDIAGQRFRSDQAFACASYIGITPCRSSRRTPYKVAALRETHHDESPVNKGTGHHGYRTPTGMASTSAIPMPCSRTSSCRRPTRTHSLQVPRSTRRHRRRRAPSGAAITFPSTALAWAQGSGSERCPTAQRSPSPRTTRNRVPPVGASSRTGGQADRRPATTPGLTGTGDKGATPQLGDTLRYTYSAISLATPLAALACPAARQPSCGSRFRPIRLRNAVPP